MESVVKANPISNLSGTGLFFFLWWPYILDESDEKGATRLLTKALKEFNKPIKLFKRSCLCKQTYQSPMRLASDFSQISGNLKNDTGRVRRKYFQVQFRET